MCTGQSCHKLQLLLGFFSSPSQVFPDQALSERLHTPTRRATLTRRRKAIPKLERRTSKGKMARPTLAKIPPKKKYNPTRKAKIRPENEGQRDQPQEQGTAPTPRRKANPKKGLQVQEGRPRSGTRTEARPPTRKANLECKKRSPTSTQRRKAKSNLRAATEKKTTKRFGTLVLCFTKWCPFSFSEKQYVFRLQCAMCGCFLISYPKITECSKT